PDHGAGVEVAEVEVEDLGGDKDGMEGGEGREGMKGYCGSEDSDVDGTRTSITPTGEQEDGPDAGQEGVEGEADTAGGDGGKHLSPHPPNQEGEGVHGGEGERVANAAGADTPDNAGEAGEGEDVAFLQFELEAKEVELARLEALEKSINDQTLKLEEESAELNNFAQAAEHTCKVTIQALPLLARGAEETKRLELLRLEVENRTKDIERDGILAREPLVQEIRSRRWKLAQRKARCQEMVVHMRKVYQECDELRRHLNEIQLELELQPQEEQEEEHLRINPNPREDRGKGWGQSKHRSQG
ncbi:unnamed protein product, partial [Discosporangium mesarthrocarpum]